MGHFILRFILWFSGTNSKIYQQCDSEVKGNRITYSLFVMAVGFFAFLTGSYFIRTMFAIFNENTGRVEVSLFGWIVSFIIGMAYAVVIIGIDRIITMSHSRWMAAVRLPLAIFIGAMIAFPLEMQFFNGRIEKQLIEESTEENQIVQERAFTEYTRIQNNLDMVLNEIAETKKQLSKWSTEAYNQKQGKGGYEEGEGPGYRGANSNLEMHRHLLEKAEDQKKQLMEQLEPLKKEANSLYTKTKINQSWDFPSRYEALANIKNDSTSLRVFGTFILIALILLDSTPALMRLFKEDDCYDLMVRLNHRLRKQMTTIISNETLDEIVKKGANAINDTSVHPKNVIKKIIKSL